ncbi:MAG: UvrD-helicase domain-containing protein, partial [Gemmatimonadetes bacterium]|nr:UvrD-helicase domain-containing protein [Gemmatimonadota bacterium]
LTEVRGRIKGTVAKGVKEFIDETAEWIDTLRGIGFESRHQSIRELLGAFVRELDETFFVRKRDRSALDFIDLEELAVRLLGIEKVARETKKRYRYLLLDECQDTNGLQLSLMRLLWNDGRFFAVGDPKQSIYHFRDADVQAYLSLGREFAEKDTITLTLSENFRSRPEIISFVNGFFSTVWTGNEALGVPYEALTAGKEAPAAPEPRIEYLSVRDDDVKEARYREAALLAERLIAINAGHGTSFGEMAILFRAGTDMPLYERALSKRNVPVVTAAGRGFFQAKEVSDLLVGLKMIDDPYDDRTVSAVLRSPLVGLGDDDFATIHLSRGRDKTPLWSWIRQDDVLKLLTDDGVERIGRFVDRFRKLRNERGRRPGHQLLDALLRDTRYLDSMLLMTFPLRRKANVRKLVSLTREIDRRSELSIHQTIRALSDYRYTRLREPESLPSDELQAVKLLTVHGAKGMEFPLVAIADMGRPIRSGDSDALLFHKELGVGIRTGADDGVIYQKIREQEKSETEAEEMRLLYVAMTRAEERLILSGSSRGKASGWLKSVEAYLTPPEEPGVAKAGADSILFLSAEPVNNRGGRRVDVAEVWSEPERYGIDRETLEMEAVRSLLRGAPPAQKPSPSGRTVSQVASSFACPRRAFLASRYPAPRRLAGEEQDEVAGDPPAAGARANGPGGAAIGTAFHRAMERIWRGADPPAALAGSPAEVMEWAEDLLADETLRDWLRDTRPLPEFSLFAEAEGRPLRGAIDLVIPRRDAWYCVDYKTDRATGDELAERYGLPLDLYRLALARVLPPETVIRTFLYAVRAREWIEVSDAGGERARMALRDWDEHENATVREGRPSALCESCAFRIDCPALLIGESGIYATE